MLRAGRRCTIWAPARPTLHPKITVLTKSGAADEIDDEHNDEYEYDSAESDVHPGVSLLFVVTDTDGFARVHIDSVALNLAGLSSHPEGGANDLDDKHALARDGDEPTFHLKLDVQ